MPDDANCWLKLRIRFLQLLLDAFTLPALIVLHTLRAATSLLHSFVSSLKGISFSRRSRARRAGYSTLGNWGEENTYYFWMILAYSWKKSICLSSYSRFR